MSEWEGAGGRMRQRRQTREEEEEDKEPPGKWGRFQRTEAEKEEDEERIWGEGGGSKGEGKVQYWKREERWRGKEEKLKKTRGCVRGRTATANEGTEAEADKIWGPLLTLCRVWQSCCVAPTAWFHQTGTYFVLCSNQVRAAWSPGSLHRLSLRAVCCQTLFPPMLRLSLCCGLWIC